MNLVLPTRRCYAVMLVVGCALLAGCKSQTKDAVLVGKSGKQMATDASAYFTSLADGSENYPFVLSLISKGLAPPTSDEIKNAHLQANEFRLRSAVFAKLADAYQSIQDYANGQSTDVEKSISGLESAVAKLNSNHPLSVSIGHASIPPTVVTEAVNKLTEALIDLKNKGTSVEPIRTSLT